MSELFSLAGQVALLTGSSRGLGFAMAEALAAHGALVVLNGRDPASLEERAAVLRARGQHAEAAAPSISSPEPCRVVRTSSISPVGRCPRTAAVLTMARRPG